MIGWPACSPTYLCARCPRTHCVWQSCKSSTRLGRHTGSRTSMVEKVQDGRKVQRLCSKASIVNKNNLCDKNLETLPDMWLKRSGTDTANEHDSSSLSGWQSTDHSVRDVWGQRRRYGQKGPEANLESSVKAPTTDTGSQAVVGLWFVVWQLA